MQHYLFIRLSAESQTPYLPLSHSAADHSGAVGKRSAEAAPSTEWSSALSSENERSGQKGPVYQREVSKRGSQSTVSDSTNEMK